MSEHRATVSWRRLDAKFVDHQYSRVHTWRFDGGAAVRASASPHVVPPPLSDPACIDPEEAFIASLSSCHMLWLLSIAAARAFVVESYDDDASGELERGSEGRAAITRVVLRPRIAFGERRPTKSELIEMHHEAHDNCFIANSVRCAVRVEPAQGD